jgi:hypothetical protein
MVSSTSYQRRYTTHISNYPTIPLPDQHTLAKKFEAVHKNTVTSRRKIPRVRRATCPNPTPALKRCGSFNFNEAGLDEDVD